MKPHKIFYPQVNFYPRIRQRDSCPLTDFFPNLSLFFEYGSISQELKNKIGFKGSVLAGILNIDHLLDNPKAATVYKELPKTFFVKRDFSLILDKSVSYASIQKIVKDSERNLLKDMNLFDVYEGKNLPEDKKSYAVSFIFQDPKETLPVSYTHLTLPTTPYV